MAKFTAERSAAARAYGKIGGRTRARNLSAAERKTIAKQGAAARWGGTSATERLRATAPARAVRAKARAKGAK